MKNWKFDLWREVYECGIEALGDEGEITVEEVSRTGNGKLWQANMGCQPIGKKYSKPEMCIKHLPAEIQKIADNLKRKLKSVKFKDQHAKYYK